MLFPYNPTQGRTNSRQPSDLNGSSERCERAANTHFDVPVIGADNILPPHTNTGAYEHPQTSHYIPADLEFERHATLRAALPIDLPRPLHEGPPSLGPDRIDCRYRSREFDVRSSRIAADGDLVLEHPEQEGLPSGKKTARGNEGTDGVFPKAQCVLIGRREGGDRTDKEGVFGRVIGAPAGYNGQVALATLAGNAGTIRVGPSKERDVRPEQPVAPEREIHTGYGVREPPALRQVRVLGRELHPTHDRRGVGPILCGQRSQTFGFFVFLRCQDLGSESGRKKPGLLRRTFWLRPRIRFSLLHRLGLLHRRPLRIRVRRRAALPLWIGTRHVLSPHRGQASHHRQPGQCPHKPLCRESWRRPYRTRRPDRGEPCGFIVLRHSLRTLRWHAEKIAGRTDRRKGAECAQQVYSHGNPPTISRLNLHVRLRPQQHGANLFPRVGHFIIGSEQVQKAVKT